MSLVLEEIKKILRIKHLLFFIVLMCSLSLTSIYVGSKVNRVTELGHRGKYSSFRGPITQEKYSWVQARNEELKEKYPMDLVFSGEHTQFFDYSDSSMSGNDFHDIKYYKWVLNEYERIINFKNENESVIRDQYEKVDYLNALNLTHKSKKIESLTKKLESRRLTSYEYVDGIERYIKSPVPLLLTLLTIIFVIISSMNDENSTEMSTITAATINGKKLKLAKYATLMLLVCVLLLIFEATTLLSFITFDFISGLRMPIFQLKSFMFFPYNWTVFTALLFHYLIKILAVQSFACLLLLMSYKIKSQTQLLMMACLTIILLYFSPTKHLLQGIITFTNQGLFFTISLILSLLIYELFTIKRRASYV